MGAAASVENATSWSKDDVATQVKGIGKAYEEYSSAIVENALDGHMLMAMDASELGDWFEGCGVVKKIHQRKLEVEFKRLKASLPLSDTAAERPAPAVREQGGSAGSELYTGVMPSLRGGATSAQPAPRVLSESERAAIVFK